LTRRHFAIRCASGNFRLTGEIHQIHKIISLVQMALTRVLIQIREAVMMCRQSLALTVPRAGELILLHNRLVHPAVTLLQAQILASPPATPVSPTRTRQAGVIMAEVAAEVVTIVAVEVVTMVAAEVVTMVAGEEANPVVEGVATRITHELSRPLC